MKVYKALKNRNITASILVAIITGPVFGMLYMNKGILALVYLGYYIISSFISELQYTYGITNYQTLITLADVFIYLIAIIHIGYISKQKTKNTQLKWYATLTFHLISFMVPTIIIFIFCRLFLFDIFSMAQPASSMSPTIRTGDIIMSWKPSYGYGPYSIPFTETLFSTKILSSSPKRGDVILFAKPSEPEITYIKRVIGLSGDTIQMKNGQLILNNNVIEHRFLETQTLEDNKAVSIITETLPNGDSYNIINDTDISPLDNTQIYTVPEKHIFVMGDNRDNSMDSRVLSKIGYIHEKFIVGKAIIIIKNGKTGKFTFQKIK